MLKKHAGTLAYLLLLFVLTNAVFAYQMIKAKALIDELGSQAAAAGNWKSNSLEYEKRIKSYIDEVEKQKILLSEYETSLKDAKKLYAALLEEKNKLQEENELMVPAYNRWNLYEERYSKADRSDYMREQVIVDNSVMKKMRVTAYTEYECDKTPDHPLFGITASGNSVKEWFTVAAGRDIPFGTRIYIPYFKDEVNNGIFVVEDRGGAIKENCIDVYMSDQKSVNEFGVKYLEVYILN